jgi:hypothetical protein
MGPTHQEDGRKGHNPTSVTTEALQIHLGSVVPKSQTPIHCSRTSSSHVRIKNLGHPRGYPRTTKRPYKANRKGPKPGTAAHHRSIQEHPNSRPSTGSWDPSTRLIHPGTHTTTSPERPRQSIKNIYPNQMQDSRTGVQDKEQEIPSPTRTTNETSQDDAGNHSPRS